MCSIPEDETHAFSAKNALLQDENLDAKQNLIIAQLENVATEEESQKLNVLLKEDKTVQQELAIFSKMKLEEDEQIVFAGKEGLIQTVRISYAAWVYRVTYTAAAILLLMLAINGIDFTENEPKYGIASTSLPKFNLPKIDQSNRDIKVVDTPQKPTVKTNNKVPFNPYIEENNSAITAEVLDLNLIPISHNIQLIEAQEGQLAYIAPKQLETPKQDDQIPSLLDRIAGESNVFNVTYGFAESMSKKVKTARDEYAEKDYIDIKFWKVHTQIKKPSWMKINRQ
jgi:hypothetical protein